MSNDTLAAPDAVAAVNQRITNMVLRHPFFSTCVLNLDVKPAPVGTACTDGTRLLYDEDFINGLEPEQISGLLAHEIMHVVLLHPFRVDKNYHNPKLANVAMDYEINNYLDLYNKEWGPRNGGNAPFPLPAGGLIDHKYDGKSWEQIYEELKDDLKQQGIDPDDCPQGGAGDFGKVDAPGQGECAPGDDEGEGEGGQGEPGDGTGEGKSGKGTKQLSQADWQSIAAKAETVSRMQGNLPANFASRLDKFRRPEIPWTEYMRRYFDNHSQDDYDMRKSDRRYLPHDIYLPTLYSESMGEVVVAIDTSGSVYGELFQQFMGEVDDVLARLKPSKTTILQCDTRITDVKDYDMGERIEPNFAMKGGGGTAFEPVFDWIAKSNTNPRVLVFFTDGYGSYPAKPPGYDVLWVDYGDYQNYPWGDVIRTKNSRK